VLGLSRRIRHLKRYREIASTLTKHGLGFLLTQAGLKRGEEEVTVERLRRAYSHLREALEELGPTFIKVGQALSTRPGLIPAELAEELSKLRDSAPPVPYEAVREVIEAELGSPPERIFKRFDPEPLATASIAQVHTALLPSGEEVAVKVQRPGVEKVLRVDTEILRDLAVLAEKTNWGRERGLVETVDEIASMLFEEVDFAKEAANCEEMGRNFAGDFRVKIPKVFWDYTTRRVLTLERVGGIRVDDVDALSKAGISPSRVVRRLVEIYLAQLLEHGLVHVDPHPGNILVLPPEGRITFLDFGAVARLSAEAKERAIDLFLSLITGDFEGVADILMEVGIFADRSDPEEIRRDIARTIGRFYGMRWGRVNLSDVMQAVASLAFKHGVRIPPDYARLMRAGGLLDALGRRLDPDFNLLEVARSYARKMARRRLSKPADLEGLILPALKAARAISRLPERLSRAAERAYSGRLRVRAEMTRLEPALRWLDRSISRLSFSIIVTGLLVASAWIMTSGAGPKIHGLPIMGVFGFGLATLFGFYLLLQLLKAGKV